MDKAESYSENVNGGKTIEKAGTLLEINKMKLGKDSIVNKPITVMCVSISKVTHTLHIT